MRLGLWSPPLLVSIKILIGGNSGRSQAPSSRFYLEIKVWENRGGSGGSILTITAPSKVGWYGSKWTNVKMKKRREKKERKRRSKAKDNCTKHTSTISNIHLKLSFILLLSPHTILSYSLQLGPLAVTISPSQELDLQGSILEKR